MTRYEIYYNANLHLKFGVVLVCRDDTGSTQSWFDGNFASFEEALAYVQARQPPTNSYGIKIYG